MSTPADTDGKGRKVCDMSANMVWLKADKLQVILVDLVKKEIFEVCDP